MSIIKCQLFLPTNKLATVDLDSEFYILPNFRVKEIANNKATDEIKLVIGDRRAWKLLTMLQITRDRFGRMDLSSVYRTKSFNDTLPGADKNSCHLKCWAFDWQNPNDTDEERQIITDWWRNLCREFNEIGAINYYTNGYHCEIGSNIQYGNTSFKVRDYRGTKYDW